MSDNTAAPSIFAGNVGTSGSGGTTTAPYAIRAIDVTFAFASGATPFTLKGLRCSLTIDHAQIPEPGSNLIAYIYGMTLDHMNQLSKAGLLWQVQQQTPLNEITVSAGDALSGMATVFRGQIQESYPDFRAQPDTPFFIRASGAAKIQLKPVPPTSYPGTVDAAEALGTMAKTAGLALENNGVSVKLASPYFHGTTFDQIVAAVRAANIYATIDSVSGVLAIWPKTGSGPDTVIISPETGMIGYPQFSAPQVTVRTEFTTYVRPLMKGPRQKIKIQSELKAANGNFNTSNITLRLESQKPGGSWEMDITAYPADGSYGQGGG